MATALINLAVPALPDADVWFANNAAWATYWAGVSGTVELDPADTTLYIPVAFDLTIVPCAINVDGIDYLLVTSNQLTSILNKLNAIDTSYQNLRSELRDAGYITNAQ
jgi:hypothetical protein